MKPLLIIVTVLVLGGAAYWIYTHPPTMSDTQPAAQNEVEIKAENVVYYEGANGYFVRPAATGTYPGIIMIHENRGLRPEFRAAADELAKEGYLVLAVDLLGPPVETQEEARALSAAYDAQKGLDNMRAAAAYLREQGAVKLASWGWCFGGSRSLELAMSGEKLDATVIYYGSRPVTDPTQLSAIKWPVMGVYGDQDQAIPTTTVDAFDQALTQAGVNHEFHMYPGVGHAFANPSNPNHHPQHTADAWQKTLDFLARTLK